MRIDPDDRYNEGFEDGVLSAVDDIYKHIREIFPEQQAEDIIDKLRYTP